MVDEDTFWTCVRDGAAPDRGGPAVRPDALPADLVHLLVNRVGVDEAEVASMSKEEAVDRTRRRYWTDGS